MGAARLRAVLDAGGIRPRKELGQNFVVDPNTIRKVVDAAQLAPKDRVLEIGAGGGSLTLGLDAAAQWVVAVELDARLLPVIEDVLADTTNVEILHADALRMSLGDLEVNRLVANLPYGIAAPVVIRVLSEAPQVGELTVMTQREVGRRFASLPGSRVYGTTSVLVRYFGEASVVANVSRNAFYPVPNVDSVVVRIVRHAREPVVARADFFAVVKAAFSQRRKMLRNTLSAHAGSAQDAERALADCGIDPRARAESLDVADFVRLTQELHR
ncbi:16S rRNA (adenine(1518)-N(6)/adenine(1519)-N(6))-dimethyltransferaseRsmA [soil metagenome]